MKRSAPTPQQFGLAGAIAMVTVLVVLRVIALFTGARQFVDSLADGLLLIMPVELFARVKELLGDQAKTWLFIGIVVLLVAIGYGVGLAIGTTESWRARAFQASAALFAAMIALVFWIDESQFRDYFFPTVITIAAGAVSFALALIWQLRPNESSEVFSDSRRQAIGTLLTGIGALVIGRDIWKLWERQVDTSPDTSDIAAAITPNNEFYTISKNFVDPDNDRGDNWSISLSGELDHPGDYSFDQFNAMGYEHTITTMLCISNTVGGSLIGTAEWSGVPLATVLDEAGAYGEFVTFFGADDYETSVPMERCRHPQAWLVWGMNGELLPRAHGAPVRAIIPGLYGMKSVKWLTGMEITANDHLGYWEQRNWTNTAVVKPMSRIDFPRGNSNLNVGIVQVKGVAFGGDNGVSRVEISTDDGESWNDADISEEPNPEGIAWSLWQYNWQAEQGTHTLVVRMVSKDGETQTDWLANPLPDGSSGWHKTSVFVNRG